MHVHLSAAFALTLCALPATGQKQSAGELQKAGFAAQQNGDLATAIRDYRAVLQLRPDSADAHTNLAAALAQNAEYDAAIAEFEAALPLTRPKHQAGVLLGLGIAFYKKGDCPHAIPRLSQVLDLKPATLQAATLLGECELKLNDPAAALAVLAPRAAFTEGNNEFAYNYGLALIRTGKLFDGAQVLQRVADTGDAPDVYMLTGSTFLQVDEFDQARRDLETAYKLKPGLPGLVTLLGIARDRAGDSYAAQAAFRDALKVNPGDFDANLYLGTILLKQHQLPEAKEHLDRAIAAQPANATALYQSGLLQSEAGDLERSAEDLKKAIAAKPAWIEPHILLVAVYTRLQRTAEAATEQKIVDQLAANR